MSERLSAAYSQVATEVEKLVTLFYESQQNQQAFMTEAYRLLQAQSREVEEIRERAYTSEQIVRLLEEILKKIAMLPEILKIHITTPGTPTGEMMPDTGTGTESGTMSGEMMPGGGTGAESGAMPTMALPAEAAEPGPAVPIPLAPPPTYELAGEQEPEAIPVVKPLTEHAEVRFLHASPDAPPVDMYADGKKIVSHLAYEALTPYQRLEAGRHRLQVFPAGKTAGAVIDTVANLKPGAHYTVAAAGTLREIRPIVVEDQPGHTKPGFARLKVVHLSPNGPAIDITLPTGKILIGHLTYKEKSQYLQVAPGVRDLEARLAGKPTVVLKAPKLRFEPNTTYTLYVLGMANEQLVPLLVTE